MKQCLMICTVLALLAAPAWGHDPGLSSVRLVFEANRLTATIVLSRQDARVLLDRSSGVAAESLTNVARNGLRLKLGDRALPVSDVSVRETGSSGDENVELKLTYRISNREAVTRIEVRSRLLNQLPVSHRQFFSPSSSAARAVLSE